MIIVLGIKRLYLTGGISKVKIKIEGEVSDLGKIELSEVKEMYILLWTEKGPVLRPIVDSKIILET